MPTKKEEALAALAKLTQMDKGLADRARELITDPVLVNQSTFGVCGMASIVRALLEIQPEKFTNLLQSLFVTQKFETAEGMEVKVDLNGLRTMFRTNLTKGSMHKELAKNPNTKFELDFLVSRSLGQIAASMDPILYTQQVDFSRLFVGNPKDRVEDLIAQGTLALRTRCLEFMLEKIVGVKKFRKMKTDTEASFGHFVTGVNKLFAQNPDTFVIVAISDFGKIFRSVLEPDNDPTKKEPGMKKRATPDQISKAYDWHLDPHFVKYTHYVVIRKPIVTGGGFYKISFWSWGFDIDDAQIATTVAHTYMKEVIVACTSSEQSKISQFDTVVDSDFQIEKKQSAVLPKGKSHIPTLGEWNTKSGNKDEHTRAIGAAIDKYHKVRLKVGATNRERFLALKDLSHAIVGCRRAIRAATEEKIEPELLRLGVLKLGAKNYKDLLAAYQREPDAIRFVENKHCTYVAALQDLEALVKNEKDNMKFDFTAFTYIYSLGEWINESWLTFGVRRDIKGIDQAVEDYGKIFADNGSKEKRLAGLKKISDAAQAYQKSKGKAGSPRMHAVFALERLVEKERDMLRTRYVS